eukprot:5281283-Amphidinium_carterae.1
MTTGYRTSRVSASATPWCELGGASDDDNGASEAAKHPLYSKTPITRKLLSKAPRSSSDGT